MAAADEIASRGNFELSEGEIAAIIERLRAGAYLDEHYRQSLFREPKEAELRYSLKEPRGSVLARTMAVPLQVVKRFGEPEDGWTNKLIFGDNLQALKTLVELKKRGALRNADGSHGVRLCYIDPPFATMREFRGKKGQLAYRDKVEGAEFIEFLRKRLIFIHELLSGDGSLYLHLDTNKVHYMKLVLDEIFGPQNFRTEIIWKRSSAHSDTKQGRAQHGRIHDTILFYSKSAQWIWNPIYTEYDEEYVRSKYGNVEEGTGRRYYLGDITGPGGAAKGSPRYEVMGVTRYWRFSKAEMNRLIAEGSIVQPSPGAVPRQKRYLDEMPGVPLQDIWTDISPVNSQAGDRLGYPTQKPIELLERILKTSSSEGDLVLDCFSGSGTTAVAAEKLRRRWIAVDCGKLAIHISQRRLLTTGGGRGRRNGSLVQPAPFEVAHAGFYDNALIEDLGFEQFEAFALDLFGCRSADHEIAGIRMSGSRQGGPVHVFPFDKTDAEMGLEYINDLHERIGAKVSGAVYVIVPVGHCDPGLFEDVIERGDATYFILRVPYSVIEALHGRGFELIGQPAAREHLNDALDAFGFDFMTKPEARLRIKANGKAVEANIQEFRRGGLDPDEFRHLDDKGRRDLAMVLLDTDYDGHTFDLDDYFFGDDLATAKWTFKVPRDEIGERMLLVLMDVHGNELSQVVDASKLRDR